MSNNGQGSGHSSGLTVSSRTIDTKAESNYEYRMSYWAWATFRDRNINDFNFYLKVLILTFILSFTIEIWMVTVVFSKKLINIVLQVLCIVGAIHAMLNIIAAKILQCRLSLNLCIFSCFNTLIVLVVYVAQILVGNVYYKVSDVEFSEVFVASIIQIATQAISMVVMYRFWEYLMYNHDFGGRDDASDSGRSSRMASLIDEEMNNPSAFREKRLTDALLS